MPVELTGLASLQEFVGSFSGAILAIGHGSKGQFSADALAETHAQADQFAEALSQHYGGADKWLLMYGGDPFRPDAPDIAHIVRGLHDRHGVKVLANQLDIVRDQWGGVDSWIDFVHYMPTRYQIMEDGQRDILWDDLQYTHLGPGFINGPQALLHGVLAVGGGPIAQREVGIALAHGIAVYYQQARTRFPEHGGEFGTLDSWIRNQPQPHDRLVRLNRGSVQLHSAHPQSRG